MAAIFVAGGESQQLRGSQIAQLRELGLLLAPRDFLLRIGPTKGVVIQAFCEGLLSQGTLLAKVLVELPQAVKPEDLDPGLRQIAAMILQTNKDHDHRNTDSIGDSEIVVGLPGGYKTFFEFVKATDKGKPTVILDGPGEALKMVRGDPHIADKVTIVKTPAEVLDFVLGTIRKLAAGVS